MWQSPSYTIVPERGSISITCSTREPLHGVYLKQSHWPKLDNVIYYEDGKEPTVDERFGGRVTFSGSQHNLTIHMHHLQPADAGTYICQVIVQDEGWGPGTLVVVTGRGAPTPRPLRPPAGPAGLRLPPSGHLSSTLARVVPSSSSLPPPGSPLDCPLPRGPFLP